MRMSIVIYLGMFKSLWHFDNYPLFDLKKKIMNISKMRFGSTVIWRNHQKWKWWTIENLPQNDRIYNKNYDEYGKIRVSLDQMS